MQELSFLAMHHIWYSHQTRLMAERETEALRRLIDAAPEGLRHWLTAKWDLERLLEEGVQTIDVDKQVDLPILGFNSVVHFKKVMQTLAKAWSGIVEMKIRDEYETLIYIDLVIA